jgi:hypothetical protein
LLVVVVTVSTGAAETVDVTVTWAGEMAHVGAGVEFPVTEQVKLIVPV